MEEASAHDEYVAPQFHEEEDPGDDADSLQWPTDEHIDAYHPRHWLPRIDLSELFQLDDDLAEEHRQLHRDWDEWESESDHKRESHDECFVAQEPRPKSPRHSVSGDESPRSTSRSPEADSVLFGDMDQIVESREVPASPDNAHGHSQSWAYSDQHSSALTRATAPSERVFGFAAQTRSVRQASPVGVTIRSPDRTRSRRPSMAGLPVFQQALPVRHAMMGNDWKSPMDTLTMVTSAQEHGYGTMAPEAFDEASVWPSPWPQEGFGMDSPFQPSTAQYEYSANEPVHANVPLGYQGADWEEANSQARQHGYSTDVSLNAFQHQAYGDLEEVVTYASSPRAQSLRAPTDLPLSFPTASPAPAQHQEFFELGAPAQQQESRDQFFTETPKEIPIDAPRRRGRPAKTRADPSSIPGRLPFYVRRPVYGSGLPQPREWVLTTQLSEEAQAEINRYLDAIANESRYTSAVQRGDAEITHAHPACFGCQVNERNRYLCDMSTTSYEACSKCVQTGKQPCGRLIRTPDSKRTLAVGFVPLPEALRTGTWDKIEYWVMSQSKSSARKVSTSPAASSRAESRAATTPSVAGARVRDRSGFMAPTASSCAKTRAPSQMDYNDHDTNKVLERDRRGALQAKAYQERLEALDEKDKTFRKGVASFDAVWDQLKHADMDFLKEEDPELHDQIVDYKRRLDGQHEALDKMNKLYPDPS